MKKGNDSYTDQKEKITKTVYADDTIVYVESQKESTLPAKSPETNK